MKYTATEWNTEADKAKFVRQFKAFVESDFAPGKFPEWFYRRLSNCFGHIAHYDQGGFYATFFTNDADKTRFLEMTREGGGYGDPAFTYSDCEQELKDWERSGRWLETYQVRAQEAQERGERRLLAELQQKYATA